MRASTFFFITASICMLFMAALMAFDRYEELEARRQITYRLTGCNGGPCYTMEEMEAWVSANKALHSQK